MTHHGRENRLDLAQGVRYVITTAGCVGQLMKATIQTKALSDEVTELSVIDKAIHAKWMLLILDILNNILFAVVLPYHNRQGLSSAFFLNLAASSVCDIGTFHAACRWK